MLPIKTPCHCGGVGKIEKEGYTQYRVRCQKCKFAGDDLWETMTVALLDWEQQVKTVAGAYNE